MGFLDSSSSIVTAILTRKGRELLANNDGSFRITKFAFGDDEINYQLYNAATNSDSDILQLPVLEPSSNELTALRYRLVTAPQGAVQVAYLIANPSQAVLQNASVAHPRYPTSVVITVATQAGTDSQYSIRSRSTNIVNVAAPVVNAQLDQSSTNSSGATSLGLIHVYSGSQNGTTYIDIIGRDSGALISIPITVTSAQVSEL
jgi:hypothetical protein